MALDRPYMDIPGATIFDGEQSRKGYHLTQFRMSTSRTHRRMVCRSFIPPLRAAGESCSGAVPRPTARHARKRRWRIASHLTLVFSAAGGESLSATELTTNGAGSGSEAAKKSLLRRRCQRPRDLSR